MWYYKTIWKEKKHKIKEIPITLYTTFSEKVTLSYTFYWKKAPSYTFFRRLRNKSLKQEVFLSFFSHVARNNLKWNSHKVRLLDLT